jgi:hypothetical protein
MPITCPTCGTANLDGRRSCASCDRALGADPEQAGASEQSLRTGPLATAADTETPSARHVSPHSLGAPSWARIVLWWVLTILGCVTLLQSARLPWATTYDAGDTTTINGFNSVSFVSGHDSVWAELQSLGVSLPDASPPAGSEDDGSSGVIVIPGLSAIPANFAGSDSSAKEGILVFVPAAIALFIALWTTVGEREHRRSMAGGVFVLAGLTLFPLLHDALTTGADASRSSGQSIGLGIYVGLAGALTAMIGSAFLYWSLRGS